MPLQPDRLSPSTLLSIKNFLIRTYNNTEILDCQYLFQDFLDFFIDNNVLHVIMNLVIEMKYEIGYRIRMFREQAKMSQKEFAVKLGVSNARVSNWETGANRPDVDTIALICEVLDVSANELLNTQPQEQLSPEALSFAREYESLSDYGKAIIKAVLEQEKKHKPQKKVPIITAGHDSDIYARYNSKREQQELAEELQKNP